MANNIAFLSRHCVKEMVLSGTRCRILSRRIGRCFQKRGLNTKSCSVKFGFMFDIDGVIVRGKQLLPLVQEAFQLLTDSNGSFKIPTVFVTNAGNTLRQKKAEQLTEWLGVKVIPDQVVMSHSPLRMFPDYQDKHILVSGQGPVKEIAHYLGFSNITTIDCLRKVFTNLDVVDHQRRCVPPHAGEVERFKPIEAVVLFGEPVRWETNLQLILDVLLTNGKPSVAPKEIPYPHLPVLACNMDLLWMAEACMPRFGHGCFLHCLEQLYLKITGRELKYTGLIGKPSGITYHHADSLLWQQCQRMGIHQLNTLYCIGDNPETDIYGANLYDRFIQRRREEIRLQAYRGKGKKVAQNAQVAIESDSDFDEEYVEEVVHHSKDNLAGSHFAQSCHSVLVHTGVYSSSSSRDYDPSQSSNHNHRDFVIDPELKIPRHETSNVYHAVKLVLEREYLL